VHKYPVAHLGGLGKIGVLVFHSPLKGIAMSKKNQTTPAVTPQSEAEAIVVQHALAFYRDMKQNATDAPFGEFLNYAETIAITQGRKFIQTSLQTLAQGQH
jgi:hypothetical protein